MKAESKEQFLKVYKEINSHLALLLYSLPADQMAPFLAHLKKGREFIDQAAAFTYPEGAKSEP